MGRLALSLACLAVCVTAPARADIFTIAGVAAEAEAVNAQLARAQAIDAGQADALQKVLERITMPQDRLYLPLATPETAAAMVNGVRVTSERSSSTRWLGELTVSFDPQSVRQYLSTLGVTPIESVKRPGVIVPLMVMDNGPDLLWDPSNVWLQSWLSRTFDNELTPIIAPGADGLDQNALTASQARAIDVNALSVFAARYRVERVYVAFYSIGRSGAGTARLWEVDITGARAPEQISRASGGDPAMVRDALVANVSDQWKQIMAVGRGVETEIDVSVLYDDIEQWSQIQDGLKDVALITRPTLLALAADGALMRWTFRGRVDQLQRAMNERGLAIGQDRAGAWIAQTAARQSRTGFVDSRIGLPQQQNPYGAQTQPYPYGGQGGQTPYTPPPAPQQPFDPYAAQRRAQGQGQDGQSWR